MRRSRSTPTPERGGKVIMGVIPSRNRAYAGAGETMSVIKGTRGAGESNETIPGDAVSHHRLASLNMSTDLQKKKARKWQYGTALSGLRDNNVPQWSARVTLNF